MLNFLATFKRFCGEKFRTKLLFSATCHPQIYSQTKIINRILTTLLRTIIQKNLKNQENYLPFIEFVYNKNMHSTSYYFPFEIVHGFNHLTHYFDLFPLPIDERICHVLHSLAMRVCKTDVGIGCRRNYLHSITQRRPSLVQLRSSFYSPAIILFFSNYSQSFAFSCNTL